MNKKKQTKNMLMDMTIEEQLLKIQEIAAELENGSLGLEEALAKYEEGVRSRVCRSNRPSAKTHYSHRDRNRG